MSNEVVALVMAGGRGTRMARTHPFAPKALVHVAGVPLLQIVLRQLDAAGVHDVVLAVRHEAERIRGWVEALPRDPGTAVRCIVEDEPLGTVGALWHLREERRTVAVMNGDLLSGVDLEAMLQVHRSRKADLTIATHAEFHRLKLGEVVADQSHRVTDYLEKPVKEYRISSGIYLLEPSVLGVLTRPEWLGFPELARRAIARGLAVFEHFHAEPWIDVNDEQDLAQAEQMLRADPAAFGFEPEQLA